MTYYQKNNTPPVFREDDPNSYTYVDGYGFTPPPPLITERRVLQRYSNGLGFATLLYFVLTAIVPFLLLGLFSIFRPAIRVYGNQVLASSGIIQIVNILSSAISLFVPFLLFALFIRIPMKVAYPLKSFSSSLCAPWVFLALAVSVIGLTSSSFLVHLLGWFNLSPHTNFQMPQDPVALTLFGIQLCVITPLVEECVFRGVVFQSMRRFGDSFALMFSSVLFALFHLNLVQAPNAFLMGLVMGYAVLHSGSLWVGIIIHAVNNFLSFILQMISGLMPAEYQEILTLCMFAFYLIAGICSLLVLVRKYPNTFMFIRSTTFSTERIKYRTSFSSVTMIFALVLLLTFIVQNML